MGVVRHARPGETVPEFHFDPDENLVRVTFSGALKASQAFESVRELIRDPLYTSGMNGLIDLRGVDSIEMFGDQVRAGTDLVARLGDAFAGARWALVGTTDPAYGIARQFELMTTDSRFEVRSFRNIEDAERYLGVGS